VVTGGVDTHKDTHTAAVLDATGRLLGHRQFSTTPPGYGLLLAWLRSHGELDMVGIEGTGAYGAGLALHLRVAVITDVATATEAERAAATTARRTSRSTSAGSGRRGPRRSRQRSRPRRTEGGAGRGRRTRGLRDGGLNRPCTGMV